MQRTTLCRDGQFIGLTSAGMEELMDTEARRTEQAQVTGARALDPFLAQAAARPRPPNADIFSRRAAQGDLYPLIPSVPLSTHGPSWTYEGAFEDFSDEEIVVGEDELVPEGESKPETRKLSISDPLLQLIDLTAPFSGHDKTGEDLDYLFFESDIAGEQEVQNSGLVRFQDPNVERTELVETAAARQRRADEPPPIEAPGEPSYTDFKTPRGLLPSQTPNSSAFQSAQSGSPKDRSNDSSLPFGSARSDVARPVADLITNNTPSPAHMNDVRAAAAMRERVAAAQGTVVRSEADEQPPIVPPMANANEARTEERRPRFNPDFARVQLIDPHLLDNVNAATAPPRAAPSTVMVVRPEHVLLGPMRESTDSPRETVRFDERKPAWFAALVKSMDPPMDPRVFADMDAPAFYRMFPRLKRTFWPSLVVAAFPKLLKVTREKSIALRSGVKPANALYHFSLEKRSESVVLPVHALCHLLCFFQPEALMRVRLVCREWRDLVDTAVSGTVLALDSASNPLGKWRAGVAWSSESKWLQRCSETASELRLRGHGPTCDYLNEFLDIYCEKGAPALKKLTIWMDKSANFNVVTQLEALQTLIVRTYGPVDAVRIRMNMDAPNLETAIVPRSSQHHFNMPVIWGKIDDPQDELFQQKLGPTHEDPLRKSETNYVIFDSTLPDGWSHFVQWGPYSHNTSVPAHLWKGKKAMYGAINVPQRLFPRVPDSLEPTPREEENSPTDSADEQMSYALRETKLWDYKEGEPRWPGVMTEVVKLLLNQTLVMQHLYSNRVLKAIADCMGEVEISDTLQKPNVGWRQLETYGVWKPFPGWVRVLPLAPLRPIHPNDGLVGDEGAAQKNRCLGKIEKMEYFSDAPVNAHEILSTLR